MTESEYWSAVLDHLDTITNLLQIGLGLACAALAMDYGFRWFR